MPETSTVPGSLEGWLNYLRRNMIRLDGTGIQIGRGDLGGNELVGFFGTNAVAQQSAIVNPISILAAANHSTIVEILVALRNYGLIAT